MNMRTLRAIVFCVIVFVALYGLALVGLSCVLTP